MFCQTLEPGLHSFAIFCSFVQPALHGVTLSLLFRRHRLEFSVHISHDGSYLLHALVCRLAPHLHYLLHLFPGHFENLLKLGDVKLLRSNSLHFQENCLGSPPVHRTSRSTRHPYYGRFYSDNRLSRFAASDSNAHHQHTSSKIRRNQISRISWFPVRIRPAHYSTTVRVRVMRNSLDTLEGRIPSRADSN